ncbi:MULTISPECIES: citrate synthase [unclassified Dietzia]|uniref:citrate synthase n=1 Tax=unclassified Dietzia TaxID=2617939 RepID=UPI000D227168|nr:MULTISPECIES: citrate synthase [unclassified Dietzia]AVZ38772.1 citrate (Si)-synthase [Dietzia sp. JS16-p6b]MBB1025165.1 citrate synthase [Dietzia sp. DQ12-76]MBB1028144.1 citrate synthase [Dietzia sp. DQ11-38-2]QGW23875.1 type II citrate synthase [Dietzia sp. DQ12-45-1b]
MTAGSNGSDRKATLSYPGGELALDVVDATCGSDAVQLGSLLAKTGMTTLDVGFVNTSACTSSITYIDGNEGILRHRGYPIDQLADNASFLEVSYLLIYGEDPTEAQLAEFTEKVLGETALPGQMMPLLQAFPLDTHPMPVFSAGVSLFGTHGDDLDIDDPKAVDLATARLLGRGPTLAAAIERIRRGHDAVDPDPSLGYVRNFLRMTFGPDYEVTDEIADALDMLLVLHADHEQNCSTSTVRMVGSSEAPLYASITGGINALYGPLHGGANQAVLEMLERIESEGGDATDYMDRVKNKVDGVKLMGFGHRVYKSYDPRAQIAKKHAHALLSQSNDPLLEIALKLEETALADDYFVERKLYPNVDFYTGLIYRAMGFPTEMFTVLFALGRMPGWIAHWREMREDPSTKINRPRQVYTGPAERSFTPISQR